ncbi:MAG: NUDIX hydrolase [Candidatus Margulisbacteria bacterium]|nr:NUDIX hydrolase [Candidatus Margulisiibacteriota bacterium]MBU1021461.1 NUDIX hydrolase [Candidatus Margulisiibacteriota bacterium]MBU1728382.1 NUDIX hydrolase [Candidatus Margulisiibacteriota bacterium]MBU1955875.1 NUDIX hydrolase [Candidatus Margulisiibacteriota bacterium]
MDGFKEETLKSTKLHNGRIISLREDEVKLPNGKVAKREIVEHPGAVIIAAVTDKKEIVLIRQYRKPVEAVIYEIPAGLVDEGESLKDAALRELKEETGYVAGKINQVLSAYTSPGYSTEVIHYFIAKDLKLTGQALDADEVVKVEIVTFDRAIKMIKDGTIKDNKTIIGIMLAAGKI